MMSGLFFAISLASALARVGKSFFATVWKRCGGGLLERGRGPVAPASGIRSAPR